jgi:hypothetical protein
VEAEDVSVGVLPIEVVLSPFADDEKIVTDVEVVDGDVREDEYGEVCAVVAVDTVDSDAMPVVVQTYSVEVHSCTTEVE